jgi:hypothetical protein
MALRKMRTLAGRTAKHAIATHQRSALKNFTHAELEHSVDALLRRACR